MKAIVFEKSGLENLQVKEIETPKLGHHDVLIRVIESGVNPIDYFVVSSIPVRPMPHIPGAEIVGVVEKVGEHVKDVKVGDKVIVYPRVFDNSCDLCLAGKEMICRNGGIFSVITQGGWAEYAVVPDRNLIKTNLDDKISASLPVAGLTAYHALREANVKPTDTVVVFGASGNTGMFAVQLAKLMGATVIAVSKKQWLKEMGADYVIEPSRAVEEVDRITEKRKADVVINAIGSSVWETSVQVLGYGGKLVTFGALTGGEVKVNISRLYSLHASIIGVTGGTRKELQELVSLCRNCKVRVWKEYTLERAGEALKELFSPQRDGRIMIKVS
ncbi:MAG: alcohol dehydrogenase catalytic domain-containing protein [Sulfolobaceae archaeon]